MGAVLHTPQVRSAERCDHIASGTGDKPRVDLLLFRVVEARRRRLERLHVTGEQVHRQPTKMSTLLDAELVRIEIAPPHAA